MGTLNRRELENLERRDLQLTILASAFVLVQAAGLACSCTLWCSSTPLGTSGRSRRLLRILRADPALRRYLLDRQRTCAN